MYKTGEFEIVKTELHVTTSYTGRHTSKRLTLANMFRFVGANTNNLSQLQQSWDSPSIAHVHDSVSGRTAACRRCCYDSMRHDDAPKRFEQFQMRKIQFYKLAAADWKRLTATPTSTH